MRITKRGVALAAAGGLAACAVTRQEPVAVRSTGTGTIPKFAVDPYWPKSLPENWILGQVSGIAVDRDDHISIDSKGNLYTAEVGYGRRAQKFNRVD